MTVTTEDTPRNRRPTIRGLTAELEEARKRVQELEERGTAHRGVVADTLREQARKYALPSAQVEETIELIRKRAQAEVRGDQTYTGELAIIIGFSVTGDKTVEDTDQLTDNPFWENDPSTKEQLKDYLQSGIAGLENPFGSGTTGLKIVELDIELDNIGI